MIPKKPDQQTIRRMLDGIEAVTKYRFCQDDPDPITGGVQVWRMPDEAGGGGEPFAGLTAREKALALGHYTPWREYEKSGVSMEQLDAVFFNVIQGLPRGRWLEGSGLDGDSRRPGLLRLWDRVAEVINDVKEEHGRRQERGGRER
jgi:hypothetical protein